MSSSSSSIRAVNAKSTSDGKCCSSSVITANAVKLGTSAEPFFQT